MKKIFSKTNLSYIQIILFAILSAVLTATLNILPIFKNTSFQDIAVNLECWILFAIFIIVNCSSVKEACIKCFMFFLISQPLIYLLEVPFVSEGFGVFRYYKPWFNLTILTIPGSIICYQLKRKNILSIIVFSPVVIYLGIMFTRYLKTVIHNFPGHLLSAIFCIVMCLLLTYALFDKKVHKLIITVLLIISVVASLIIDKGYNKSELILPSSNTTYYLEDSNIAAIVQEEDKLIITSKANGTSKLELNDNGKIITYYITVTNGNIFISDLN